MQVIEYGADQRESILLLHGGGLSWWNYREAAELLKNEYHILLPILDGHAGSDRPFTTIEENAAEIISMIDERCGGSVRMIGGLSLGAQILLEILSQRQKICGKRGGDPLRPDERPDRAGCRRQLPDDSEQKLRQNAISLSAHQAGAL